MRHLSVVERRAWIGVPRQPAVLCKGRGCICALSCLEQCGEIACNAMFSLGEMGEDMTTKSKKSMVAKKSAKEKAKATFPVKAWEKLKGRGPFPQVVVDADARKCMKKM